MILICLNINKQTTLQNPACHNPPHMKQIIADPWTTTSEIYNFKISKRRTSKPVSFTGELCQVFDNGSIPILHRK